MATFTSNFALTKPDYGEAAAIAVINGNTDEIDEIMHDNRYMMADAWSSSVSYAVGDLCIYENALYKCVTATSGNWDASCWEVTTLAENLGGTPEVSKTATGNPLELTDAASAPMVRCVTEIQGTQDLHGYSKPWVGGANVNKLDPSTLNPGYILSSGAIATPTNTKEYYSPILDIGNATLITVGYNAYASGETVWLGIGWYQSDDTFINREVAYSAYKTFTVPENASKVMVSMRTFDHGLDYCFLALSDTTTFTPYSNICPITAYTDGSVVVSDEDNNTTTHTTTYPTAIYRGSEDVAEGSVTAECNVIDLGSLTWLYNSSEQSYAYFYANIPDRKQGSSFILSSAYNTVDSRASLTDGTIAPYNLSSSNAIAVRDDRFSDIASFTTGVTGVQLAYELATPTTSTETVSNAPIRTLSGYNHIASTTGDMEVEYITREYEPIIKAAESELGEKYSTSERVVGKWIDGKPIYEKTIVVDSLARGDNTITHNISNAGTLIYTYGKAYNPTYKWLMFPMASSNSNYILNVYGFDTTSIRMEVGNNFTDGLSNITLTIRYTKTTD